MGLSLIEVGDLGTGRDGLGGSRECSVCRAQPSRPGFVHPAGREVGACGERVASISERDAIFFEDTRKEPEGELGGGRDGPRCGARGGKRCVPPGPPRPGRAWHKPQCRAVGVGPAAAHTARQSVPGVGRPGILGTLERSLVCRTAGIVSACAKKGGRTRLSALCRAVSGRRRLCGSATACAVEEGRCLAVTR